MKKILLLTLSLLLVGCSIGQIEDTNGDEDYTIETISNEKIISGGSSASLGSIQTTVNGNTKYKVDKFSGIKTIETFRLNNESFNLSIMCEVEKGNFMVALTTDSEIVKVFKNNDTDNYVIDNHKGTYYLKIVGESAKFNISYSNDN